jgi:membrane-associated phospholipid phosphatase
MQLQHIPAFIKRHFVPESYLGLQLLIGLAVLLVAIWAFVYVAEDVMTNDPIVQFDTTVANAVHANATPALTQLMLTISVAGSEFPLVATIILALYWLWRRRGYHLLLLVLAVGGSQLVNALLKLLFQRARPSFSDPLTSAVGFSFPSGHAMGAMVFYGLFAYWLVRDAKTAVRRVVILLFFLIAVGLIGLSRIYLGAHYPSDVFAGYSAGLAWLALTITGIETYRSWRQHNNQP